MIAGILYTGKYSTIKALSRNCKLTLHRHGQPREDIDTWLHAYSTQVRTAQERQGHMIARILYTGTDNTTKTLAHDCTHILPGYAQQRKDICTWRHAYSTQVRTGSTGTTLAHDCTHTLSMHGQQKKDITTFLFALCGEFTGQQILFMHDQECKAFV